MFQSDPRGLAALFGGGGGGGDGILPDAMDSREANTLALLEAMQSVGEAGTRRTASPIGSIAQALGPLLMAPIQARQMERQSALQDLLLRAKIADLLGGSGVSPEELALTKAKTEHELAQAEKTRAEAKDPRLGKDPTEMSLQLEALGPGASPQAVLDALQNRKIAVAEASAGTSSDRTLQRQKDLELFKRDLPPKLSEQDRQVIHTGKTLLGLLDEAESVVGKIPKDIDKAAFAESARNYQLRSLHPMGINTIQSIPGAGVLSALPGVGSIFAGAPSDPKLDEYLSWVGQVQSALASFNVRGQRGGIRLVEYLKDHFPNYADSPADAIRKSKNLRTNKAVIQRQIEVITSEIEKAGQMAEAPGGGQAVQGWAGRSVFSKDGTEKRLWVNPGTGASILLDPGQMPPLE